MPYIKPEDRERLNKPIRDLTCQISTMGSLNYVITCIAVGFLNRIGRNYSNISNVIGTLTLIPMEMGRRLIAEYEDEKISENGDIEVYEPKS